MIRRLLLALALVAGATSALAQTPTPVRTPSRQYPSHPGSATVSTLLDAATSTGTGPGVHVGFFSKRTVQIIIGATCTSYTLAIQGSNDGSNWATVGSTLSESDVAAGGTKLYDLNSTFRFVRANLSAVSSCTVTVKLYAVAE